MGQCSYRKAEYYLDRVVDTAPAVAQSLVKALVYIKRSVTERADKWCICVAGLNRKVANFVRRWVQRQVISRIVCNATEWKVFSGCFRLYGAILPAYLSR
jgi:hypothetical protein